jgi:hypothetical protein
MNTFFASENTSKNLRFLTGQTARYGGGATGFRFVTFEVTQRRLGAAAVMATKER